MSSAYERLDHIKTAIVDIRAMLAGKSFEDVRVDRMTRLAMERCLEIISEASRHVPSDLKAAHGQAVPWQQVADIGNILRHVYQHTSLKALWSIYTDDLDTLEAAVDAMMAATPPAPPRP